jgi:hypothetical protein
VTSTATWTIYESPLGPLAIGPRPRVLTNLADPEFGVRERLDHPPPCPLGAHRVLPAEDQQLGWPIAESWDSVSTLCGIAPVEAANRALERAGIGWSNISVVELNEAFASQCLADIGDGTGSTRRRSTRTAGRSLSDILSGRPGARVLGSLAHELRRRGGGWGLAALCIGVGHALALVLEA